MSTFGHISIGCVFYYSVQFYMPHIINILFLLPMCALNQEQERNTECKSGHVPEFVPKQVQSDARC
jgi:hypothetical protein